MNSLSANNGSGGDFQKRIEKSTHWRKNLLGLVRGRIFYNINRWYEGLTLLPLWSQQEDMEKMMGQNPVDFATTNIYDVGEATRYPGR